LDVATLPGASAFSGLSDPSALAVQAASGNSDAGDAAAKGFEGLFASLLVKQMRESLGPDSIFGRDHSEVLGGLFDFYLGQHLAQSGAFGIGAMIKKQLQAREQTHDQHANSPPGGAGP
jgi:peptidoglycan hydrolase FlgJ